MRQFSPSTITNKIFKQIQQDFLKLQDPGVDSPFTVLNVLGADIQTSRFLADSLNCGRSEVQYYRDNDLAIGAVINVFGRRVILTECDKFTEEYFRVKYGLGKSQVCC